MSAATAMIASEARLLVRNPGVVLWTVILPVAAAIVIAAIPAARKPVGSFGGLSTFQVYQPILVLFVLSMLAVQALPDVLTRYREMGVLKRLRTTPVSPFLLLTAQFVLIMGVSLVCLALIVVIPGIISGQWPHHLFGFVVSYLLSCWAFLGLGMVIASLFRNAKVAAGFGTLAFFVLQFFAGLWIPRSTMPGWMHTISNLTPSGAGTQALVDTATTGWPPIGFFGTLVVWGALATIIAMRTFQWE
ncbi:MULTISPECIES: ABC transporter permease [Gordonia]|uniref:ABC transporter permease n=1 Tax=Gordonia TaxID=2053 RepID=UPI000375D300|nr:MULTISPECIES: ABC transporter permease [Gordonia]MDF3282909.1 ABC transporter permease [Gordonia sp. N1V]WCB38011.1 ABC transporter permease [Gordonia polyisoprenivorans]